MALSHFVRCFATFTNLFLLAISCSLLATSFLAYFSPPPQNVAPDSLRSFGQYIITILLISSYASALFVLCLIGLISLCFINSFLLFVYILGQVAMIGALVVSFAFTLTVRSRVHSKLEEGLVEAKICASRVNCERFNTFTKSETMFIYYLFAFLLVQIVQLGACWYLCERRSNQEKYKLQLKKADEDDE